MYAVVFDLDIEILKAKYPNSYNNAYSDIRNFLEGEGFEWTQGSVYFGTEKIDAVKCVLAVQKLNQRFNWFRDSVRDIRMLRIEEKNNLMDAINPNS